MYKSPVMLLFLLKVKWHKYVIKSLLTRFKIITIFLCLLLVNSFQALFNLLLTVPHILLVSNFNKTLYVNFIIYQFLIVFLFLLQLQSFDTSWDKYLQALPFTKFQHLLSKLLMLTFINSILWIPLILEFLSNPNADKFFRVIVLIIVPLAIELCVLKTSENKKTKYLIKFPRLFGLWNTIQLKALFRQAKAQVYIIIFFMCLTFCICKFLQIRLQLILDVNSVYLVLVMLTSLLISSFFVTLHNLRKEFIHSFSVLPVTKFKIFISDYLLIAPQLLIWILIVNYWVNFHISKSLIIINLSSFLLLGVTYYPQIRFAKYGHFISFLIAIIFIWVNCIFGVGML